MQPVQGGFETHRIRGDGDYEAKKRAAIAQSQRNSYMQGVQKVFNDGIGDIWYEIAAGSIAGPAAARRSRFCLDISLSDIS